MSLGFLRPPYYQFFGQNFTVLGVKMAEMLRKTHETIFLKHEKAPRIRKN